MQSGRYDGSPRDHYFPLTKRAGPQGPAHQPPTYHALIPNIAGVDWTLEVAQALPMISASMAKLDCALIFKKSRRAQLLHLQIGASIAL
jgi:hypothetical protein